MSRNPYAAPEAVIDPIEVHSQRPHEVTYAVRLLWIALLLSIASTALTAAPDMVVNVVKMIMMVMLLLWAWLISRIAAGRNWARWLFVVLTAISVLHALLKLHVVLTALAGKPLMAVLAAVNWLLQLAACCLLIAPRAGAWFKPSSPLAS